MKKIFLICVSLICAAVVCSSLIISASPQKVEPENVQDDFSANLSTEEAVLLSMLNRNFVYGSDFDSADQIVNLSLHALLPYENMGDGFVETSAVKAFVNNMYGVKVSDILSCNAGCPQKEGFVFAGACEHKKYTHSNISLIYNEDTTVTAATDVSVVDENGKENKFTATTLFVPNDESVFGYNIVYSEISGGVDSGVYI